MATSELNFGHMSPSDRARESVKTSLDAMRIFVYSLFTKTGNLALVFLHKSHDGVWNIGVAKGSEGGHAHLKTSSISSCFML